MQNATIPHKQLAVIRYTLECTDERMLDALLTLFENRLDMGPAAPSAVAHLPQNTPGGEAEDLQKELNALFGVA